MAIAPMKNRQSGNYLSLAFFLVLVTGGGMLIGYITAPDVWYASLNKPSFNPPNWLLAPVWSLLYIFIAIAGWRLWVRARESGLMKLWIAQLVFNFLWSPAFFALHRIDIALGIILLLLATLVSFIAVAWRADRIASALFFPYALWVGFATLLNTSLLFLN